MNSIALAEAGAILKSPGFLLAAFAPFAILILGVVALTYISSQDPRAAISISSDRETVAERAVALLSEDIGPSANKTRLRDAQAGHWHPALNAGGVGDAFKLGEHTLPVAASVTIDTNRSRVQIEADRTLPPYLVDLVRAASANALLQHETGRTLEFTYSKPQSETKPSINLSEQLIWLLTVAMATAAGALAAASTHALTTAYLEQPDEMPNVTEDRKEAFLGKLIGIGSAYSTLALPWGIIIAGLLALLTLSGDPDLIKAMGELAASAFSPFRLLLFLICTLSGYALFASIALMIALRSKSAAAARSLTGPLSFLAIAPAPLALAFSNSFGGPVFTGLTWVPLTSAASIQIGFGSLNSLDLMIRAFFLLFVAVAIVRFALAQEEARSIA